MLARALRRDPRLGLATGLQQLGSQASIAWQQQEVRVGGSTGLAPGVGVGRRREVLSGPLCDAHSCTLSAHQRVTLRAGGSAAG